MKIRTKLTILLLTIGLVPSLLFSAVSYIIIGNELTRKTVDQLTSTASSQQQKINGLLQKKQEEATKLANQFDLQSALAAYINNHDAADQEEIYTILLNKKVATPDIQAIDAIGLDGMVVASTLAGNENKKLPATDYAVKPDEESNISVKEDPRDGIDKLYITNRVSINKKESGYLNLVFRVDDIVAAIQDYTGLGVTGETIVAAKGPNNLPVSLFPLRFDTDGTLKTKLNLLGLFDANQQSYIQAVDYRGHAVIVAPRSVGFADWIIATKIDLGEALAPITQLRNALLIIVAFSSVAICILTLYFTRFFTKPILQVAEVALNIGRGSFSSRVSFRRKDELGDLGRSINAMGQSLQDFVTSIKLQRNRLAIIINSTTESILAIDQHGVIILANDATSELTGQPANATVGKSIYDIFAWKRDMQPFKIDYGKATAHTYSGVQYVNAAGDIHYVKVFVSPVSGKQRLEGPQTIVTIHDETKSRELEDMKIDFVSMAAHELRTPLAATRGYLELVMFKEGADIKPDTRNYLQQALKSTTELGSLINNLLGVTRIERGTLPFNPEKVDVAADVQQAVRNANFTAADKQISLSYEGPESGCFVTADQVGLHEVINNLLTNAIKYTNNGGRVIVKLNRVGNMYALNFVDNGIGIPRHARPNLFTKFYRVHGGLNSGSTGTGLGLFISKSIIERHGGTISVESEEGKGSTFTVRLPVYSNEQLAALRAEQVGNAPEIGGEDGWHTQNIAR